MQKFVPRSRVGIFRNERTRSTPLDPKLKILVRFILFGCIWDRLVAFTELGAKRAEKVQKFVPRSRVGIFRNECTRSTPLDPKLKILVRFVLFGCIWNRLVALQNSLQNGPN